MKCEEKGDWGEDKLTTWKKIEPGNRLPEHSNSRTV
jgi:hypothetical protein